MIQMSCNVLERMCPSASGLPMNVSLNNMTMNFWIDITVNWMYFLYSFVLGSLHRYQLNQRHSSETLAYTSLSTSLLAAFGAVLGKQWLGHFKTTRFGRGTLQERCQRRQKKLDGLEAWHFSTIIATLPIFLQLSLSFFGIALAANIWRQQHTIASVIMATTAFGVIFYFKRWWCR